MESDHRIIRPSTLIYGNARTGADDSEQFLAADAELVAYGVSKDATEEQLKQFITSKGINVTAVKKLTTFEEARTYTFKVSIKASDYEKALKPEVWPLRVGVRPFRPKRSNNQTQSWAQQSASSGGLVQAQQSASSGGFVPAQQSSYSFGGARSKTGGNNVHGFPFVVPSAPQIPPITPLTTGNMFSLLGQLDGSSSVFNGQN